MTCFSSWHCEKGFLSSFYQLLTHGLKTGEADLDNIDYDTINACVTTSDSSDSCRDYQQSCRGRSVFLWT
jgi:hypothetical protein